MHHVTLWLHSLATIIVGAEACHSSRELPRKQSCNRHPRPALNDGSSAVDPCLLFPCLESGHMSTKSKLNEPELCLVWVRYGPQPDCYLGWQNQEVNYCMVYAPAVQLDWIGAIFGFSIESMDLWCEHEPVSTLSISFSHLFARSCSLYKSLLFVFLINHFIKVAEILPSSFYSYLNGSTLELTVVTVTKWFCLK